MSPGKCPSHPRPKPDQRNTPTTASIRPHTTRSFPSSGILSKGLIMLASFWPVIKGQIPRPRENSATGREECSIGFARNFPRTKESARTFRIRGGEFGLFSRICDSEQFFPDRRAERRSGFQGIDVIRTAAQSHSCMPKVVGRRDFQAWESA